jgi:hypothetical protein
MIDFRKVEKGDTLLAGDTPHYRKNSLLPAYQRGETLMVDKVYPAGVKVKSQKGVYAEFYFAHGAGKLDYTDETVLAIKKREDFAREEAAANGEPDPTLADLHAGMLRMSQQLEATKLELANTKAQLAAGTLPQPQLDSLRAELAKTQEQLKAAVVGAQLPGKSMTPSEMEEALAKPGTPKALASSGKMKGE